MSGRNPFKGLANAPAYSRGRMVVQRKYFCGDANASRGPTASVAVTVALARCKNFRRDNFIS